MTRVHPGLLTAWSRGWRSSFWRVGHLAASAEFTIRGLRSRGPGGPLAFRPSGWVRPPFPQAPCCRGPGHRAHTHAQGLIGSDPNVAPMLSLFLFPQRPGEGRGGLQRVGGRPGLGGAPPGSQPVLTLSQWELGALVPFSSFLSDSKGDTIHKPQLRLLPVLTWELDLKEMGCLWPGRTNLISK